MIVTRVCLRGVMRELCSADFLAGPLSSDLRRHVAKTYHLSIIYANQVRS